MDGLSKRIKAGYVYVLFVHLLLAVVLWRPDFIRKVETNLGIQNSESLYFYKKMTRYHQDMDGSIPSDAVIFIGDSITQALAISAISHPSVNFGIGSDTTKGVSRRIRLYKSIERSRVVVLAIGINDVHKNVDRLETITNYQNILDSIPPETTVIASSVLPIGSSAQKGYFSNATIASLNNEIETLTKAYKNVIYVNSNTALKNDMGFLRPEFHVGDGVHLSDKGYGVLIENIKASLSTISKS